jgi:hypothetical protein
MRAFCSWVRVHECACYAQPCEELMCFTHLVALAHDRNSHPPDHLRRSANLVCFPRVGCSTRWGCSGPTLTHFATLHSSLGRGMQKLHITRRRCFCAPAVTVSSSAGIDVAQQHQRYGGCRNYGTLACICSRRTRQRSAERQPRKFATASSRPSGCWRGGGRARNRCIC